MTKISDVEANLEQFKSETLASQEETRNLCGQMRESINRNKVEADKQFAEIMQQIKALRPTPLSIDMPASITPPATHPATPSSPLPHHTAAAATPHHPGFPLPMTHTGEFSVNRNHCPQVSSEGIFQNYPGNTFRDAGGIFANTIVPPTSTVHGSERGWQPITVCEN
ncbi:hypothetical protein Tco_0845865 [Tanacetum coccineum]